ncbi:double-strand break repair protein AddB, partial [Methylobacterium jeotgali]
ETVRAREAMLSQALRPAATTDAWARLDPAERDRLVTLGLDGLSVVEAGDEREEALIAAIALRETLETPGRVAALVTPDRALAMRVAAELARWDIRAEDAAGQPLSGSLGGRLARLAAEFAVETVGPRIGNRQAQRLLALLAHPLVRLGMARPELVRGAAALEIGVLRGPALAPGFETLRGALAAAKTDTGRRPRPKRRLKDIDWELAEKLVAALEDAFKGFPGGAGALDLVAAGEAHRAVCEALLKGPEGDEEAAADPSLACLDSLFDELAFVDAGPMGGEFSDYPAFFAALADLRCVPDAHGAPHPRVRILGLAEARLLSCDRIVLGGLDEGVWPARMVTDSFLNRPMRERIGLDPPERQIGQGAHDFVGLLGHRDAVITRAQKREGAPTVQSRFLQRMRAFADQTHWEAVLTRGRRLAGLAARLDAGTEPPPPRLTQPRPRPDPALFPRALSVTEVETLVRDPYAIFARHVLGLDPLEPVAAPPGVGDRGTLIHAVLGRFAEAFPQGMPADADTRLAAIAEEVFAPVKAANPELYAEWWPRLQRLSEKFLPWEAERRAAGLRVHAEANGRWSIPMGDEVFVLKARADRIETRRDGGACLIDFKTGTPPSNREVFAGFSPQLTLEAAMLMAGAFKDIPAPGTVPDLLYVHASGGRTPLRERLLKPEKDEERDIAALVEEHAARLRGLVARFMTGKAAYVSRPYPKYVRYAGDYDHLARVLEWSLAGEGEA